MTISEVFAEGEARKEAIKPSMLREAGWNDYQVFEYLNIIDRIRAEAIAGSRAKSESRYIIKNYFRRILDLVGADICEDGEKLPIHDDELLTLFYGFVRPDYRYRFVFESKYYEPIETQELLCKGWFHPPNTYDCGSFVVN